MLKRVEGEPIDGRLVYRYADRTLDVEPHPDGGVTSVLVNDAQIEIDEDGRLMYVWGYCPHESWRPWRLNIPNGSVGCVRYIGDCFIPGVSIRLNKDPWPITFDDSSGWLCIGNPLSPGETVQFSPGAMIALEDGKLVALWLRPELNAWR